MLVSQVISSKFSRIFSSHKTVVLKFTKYFSSDCPDTPPKKIDRSKVPELDEHDIEEKFISGSGPGGQKVNKAVNCCQLKHLPTGIVVKVHQQRELEKNRKIARELLISKLDDHYNGQDSVANQKKQIALYRINLRDSQRKRLRTLKEEFREKMKDEAKRGTESNQMRHDVD